MSDNIKVRYSFKCIETHSGTLDMSREDYNKLKAVEDSDELATRLADRVDIQDPSDFEYTDCDTFEEVR